MWEAHRSDHPARRDIPLPDIVPVLEIRLQPLDGRAGDQPPEVFEVAPCQQAVEDGSERALPLEDQQHLIRRVEAVLEGREAVLQGDDVPVELPHHPPGVDAAVRFHEAEDALLAGPEREDAVRPEERLLVPFGQAFRKVDAGQLPQASARFRAAVRAGRPEVVVVELDGVAVLAGEAVEFDAEIDRQPPVRNIGERERVAVLTFRPFFPLSWKSKRCRVWRMAAVLLERPSRTICAGVVAMLQGLALRREVDARVCPRAHTSHHRRVPQFHYPGDRGDFEREPQYALHLTLAQQTIGDKMSSELLNTVITNTEVKTTGFNDKKCLDTMAAKTYTDPALLYRLSTGRFAVKVGKGMYPRPLSSIVRASSWAVPMPCVPRP